MIQKDNKSRSNIIHKKNNSRIRILIIGSLPPPIGGTTVSLRYLVNALKANREVEVRVVDTGGVRGSGMRGLFRLAALPCRLFAAVRKADVITLHCCTPGLPVKGGGVLLLSRLFRKSLIIRKFAGTDYRFFGIWRGRLAEFVLRHADLYLPQTQDLVAQATERGLDNVRWFPNHRPFQFSDVDAPWRDRKTACKHFVYVGHVRECKGMRVLAEAARKLPHGVTIDVYGPWFDDLDRHVFDNSTNIQYRGSLKPEEVVPTMREYNAFVFPTHHAGEGYPGVIFEAYNAALPVVTTRWLALPEIVDENVGILVEPKNAEDLCQAMTRLSQDDELFQRLRGNTREKAEFFSAERWAGEFVSICRELAEGTNPQREGR